MAENKNKDVIIRIILKYYPNVQGVYVFGSHDTEAESFELLQKKNVIDQRLKEKLKNMVHFRNTVIHDYQRVNLDIVKSVINSELNDLVLFGDCIMAYVNSHSS